MSIIDALYQDAILTHYRRPRNRGVPPTFDIEQEGVNPSCGDEVTLYLSIDNGKLASLSFTGQGCAISQAAASMMTEAASGRSIDDVRRLALAFTAMLRGEEPSEELGELALLKSVAKVPARVKCAALPFVTLLRALEPLT